MAASDKKRKSKQSWTPGSGLRRQSLAKKAIVRTKMKIKRWQRYNQEIGLGTRPAPLKKVDVVDTKRWDTTGLESHLKNLQAIVKHGASNV